MFHLPSRHWSYVPLAEQLANKTERATIDFETRSARPIRDGSWLYAKHPSTRVLCLAFLLPGQCPLHPSLWAPAMGGHPAVEDYPLDDMGDPYSLERLFEHIRKGGLVEAHNVAFEANIWQHLFSKPEGGDELGATGTGAPRVKDTQWRCSAAKAATYALPRDLEGAGLAMDMPKHLLKFAAEGTRLLNKYSKPRKARKGEDKLDPYTDEPLVYWHAYDEEDFGLLYRYCRQDVVAEHALSSELPDLSTREYAVWLADFRGNRRGVRIDVDLVRMAIKLEAELKAKMNATLQAITQDDDRNPEGIRGTERAKLLAWLGRRGLFLPDSTAETLDHLMASSSFDMLDSEVQTVVRIARNINRASVSKYKRILQCIDWDDLRVRELVMYHGAATGRWSGKGIQVQNFPKGNIAELLGISPKSPLAKMAVLVEDIKAGDLGWLEVIYGDALSALSSAIRGVLIPSPGKVFFVADYSAIEARVVLWLAGAKKALDVFRAGKDIYCDMAEGIYRRPINKDDNPKERGFGKVAILGLGYGMGWLTFLLTLRDYKIKFKPADALEVLGGEATKYVKWVNKQLWPVEPQAEDFDDDEDYREEMRLYRGRQRQATAHLRRLRDSRETPGEIIQELALCKYTVDTYRARYPEVKKLWALQESAATQAVAKWKRANMEREDAYEAAQVKAKKMAKLGKTFYYEEPPPLEPIFIECGMVTWVVEGRWLFCYLPSGRRLAYNLPDVKGVMTPWGEKRLSLRFMGVHKKTKKWARMASYGGSIVENEDQGIARDMMADAIARIDAGLDSDFEFDYLTSIHDEGLSEGDDMGEAINNEHMEDYRVLLTTLEPCYAGCPVAAEGAPLRRYQK